MSLEIFNLGKQCAIKNLYSDMGSNFMGGANILSIEEEEYMKTVEISLKDVLDRDEIQESLVKKKN